MKTFSSVTAVNVTHRSTLATLRALFQTSWQFSKHQSVKNNVPTLASQWRVRRRRTVTKVPAMISELSYLNWSHFAGVQRQAEAGVGGSTTNQLKLQENIQEHKHEGIKSMQLCPFDCSHYKLKTEVHVNYIVCTNIASVTYCVVSNIRICLLFQCDGASQFSFGHAEFATEGEFLKCTRFRELFQE